MDNKTISNLTAQQIMERDNEYVANTYSRFPVTIVSGQGARCTDADGKEYLDMTAGIGVNALGFCDPQWAAAVAGQAATMQHISNLFYTVPCGQTAETLCKRTGAKKVFFCNSGAEANEGAIKAARKYSFAHYGEGRNIIVTLVNSFHGRTVTTLSATGQDAFHQYFFPFTEGFSYALANDVEDTIEKLSKSNVCALMLELVQGEGGVIALDSDYVTAVANHCRDNDILLIIDEVQTGIGRTGTLFAYQQFGIAPDVVSCAKGLGGGLPIGGVLLFEKTKDALVSGDHGSTFGGNPVCCAGANAVLAKLDEPFLKEVAAKGAYLKDKLSALPQVKSVSGLGMMLGIEFDNLSAKEVQLACIELGLLTLTAKTKLRLLPPLSITMAEIDEGLEILSQALSKM